MGSIFYHPKESMIASGSGFKSIILWSTEKGTIMKELTGPSLTIRSFAYSEDGRTVAAIIWNKKVRIWSAITG